MALGWYVATTHHHSETIAVHNLRRQGLRPFLPLLRLQRLRRGSMVEIVRPYISGYVFIEFDVELHVWKTIYSTRGIRGLLSVDPETPSRVRRGVIEALISQCDGAGFVDEQIADRVLFQFAPGTPVKVTAGPFQNMIGTVAAYSAKRARIILDLLGRSTVVSVNGSTIEKLCK